MTVSPISTTARKIAAGAVGAVLALGLAACGGQDKGSDKPSMDKSPSMQKTDGAMEKSPSMDKSPSMQKSDGAMEKSPSMEKSDGAMEKSPSMEKSGGSMEKSPSMNKSTGAGQ